MATATTKLEEPKKESGDALPTYLIDLFDAHKEAKSEAQAAQERCKSIWGGVDAIQKQVTAAEQEGEALRERAKIMVRKDGADSDQARKLRSQAIERTMFAEDAAETGKELTDELLDARMDSHDKRRRYLDCRSKALDAYARHRLERSFRELMETSQGKAFVAAKPAALGVEQDRLVRSNLYQGGDGEPGNTGTMDATTRAMFFRDLERVHKDLIASLYLDWMKANPVEDDDPVIRELEMLPKSPTEGDSREVGGPAARHYRRVTKAKQAQFDRGGVAA